MNNLISQNGLVYQQIDVNGLANSLIKEQTDSQDALDAANQYLANAQTTITAAQARLDAATQAISTLQTNTDPVIVAALSSTALAPVQVQPLPPITNNPPLS